jgi:CspA family cold shock protein
MKTGTVRWFSPLKGHGFIHPDDGGPNIFVGLFAVECAGMSRLKEGQRLTFEVRSDKRTGIASAVLLAPLLYESFRDDRRFSRLLPTATTPPLNGRFSTTNAFDIISDIVSSALLNRTQR